VTSAGTTTLAYDYEGRISTITYPSSATNSFTYNGLDTRVGKVDSAGTTTYRRDGDDVLSPVLEAGGTKFTPGISRRTGTSSYFYHQDRVGSLVRQTNSTQGSLTSRQYDAFGNVAYVGGTWVGPFGFVGGEGYQEDSDSGLQLLGHRYYDPSTGRFLTRDPIKDGSNWYGYCANNPLKWVDAQGLGADEALPAIEKGIREGKLPPGTDGKYQHDHDWKGRIHDKIGKEKARRGVQNGKHNDDLTEDEIIDIVRGELPDPDLPPRSGGRPRPSRGRGFNWDGVRDGVGYTLLAGAAVAAIILFPEVVIPAITIGGGRLITGAAGGR
jgi:RHS repeat-associated protein